MRGKLCLTIMMLAGVTATSRAVTLYDGSQNTLPEQQGWLIYAGDAAVPTKTAGGGKTTFDSGTSSTRAGWSNTVPIINTLFNPLFPTLDRNNGFVLGFDVKLLSESHADNDRAGFDVILLSSDHRGVELSFFTDRIFAQTISGTDFVHGEDALFNTTNATHYDLGIQGSTYVLSANGTPLLSGNVRDYSTALAVPYGLNNYLFVGDDTSRATAAIELSGVTIVPEPVSSLLLSPLLLIMRSRRRSVG